jgi:hypothetical protein
MKKIVKESATSLTALIFLIVGTTGVLMFFHLFENATKELHEILGLVFVSAALLHVYFNWGAMKRYFPKKVFLIFAALSLITVIGFVSVAPAEGENPKRVIIGKLLKAPLQDAIKILGKDMASVTQKLEQEKIQIANAHSIEEIAKQNSTSPFRIVSIINK